MNTTEINQPVPELNLSGISLGDEVTIVKFENRKWKVGATIYLVYKIEDSRVLVRRKNQNQTCGGWLIRNNGAPAGPYTSKPAQCYYSANPKHIELAKKNLEVAARQLKEQEIEDLRKLEEFSEELKALLEKHKAYLEIHFGEGSDTHGIYNEKIVANIGQQSIDVYTND